MSSSETADVLCIAGMTRIMRFHLVCVVTETHQTSGQTSHVPVGTRSQFDNKYSSSNNTVQKW